MEQLVNTANELIAVIVNYAAFFIIYGAIFYFIGALIVILCHITALPGAIVDMFRMASSL